MKHLILKNTQAYMIWMVLFFLLLIVSPQTFAKSPAELQTVQIFFENDLFGETDKYYTNAVQVTWLSKDLKQYRDDVRLPEWTFPIIRAIPFSGDPESIHNVGILFGQQIYTPSDIQTTDLIEDDRPYAGYLYGGLALHSKTETMLDTLEIVLGIVGPAACAELSQNTVHDVRSIPTAKGWDNQLSNELATSLTWQRKWRVHKMKFFDLLEHDFISHAGLTLGNVRIATRAGGEIRFGYHIPRDFGSDVIRSGAGVSAAVIGEPDAQTTQFGVHLFASTQAALILHDIFLDGNTFANSHSVDKEPLVADLSIGMAFSFDTVKLTYRHLFRTQQFENQDQGQTIGSLSLTFSF